MCVYFLTAIHVSVAERLLAGSNYFKNTQHTTDCDKITIQQKALTKLKFKATRSLRWVI